MKLSGLAVVWLIALCLVLPACATQTAADEQDTQEVTGVFPEMDDAMSDVDAALARAQAADKKLLLVLGANWCHDSKALLKHLADADVSARLAEDYEVQLINVGWYERGFDVAERFGLAIYTHTPTVLIIDPDTERVRNAHDQQVFRDSYKLTAEEVREYLAAKVTPAGSSVPVLAGIAADPAYQARMAEIDALEQAQAVRIRAAYKLIAPKLEADSEDLMTYWRPVQKLRYQLPDDLVRLRQEAALCAESREDCEPFPAYPAFPWE